MRIARERAVARRTRVLEQCAWIGAVAALTGCASAVAGDGAPSPPIDGSSADGAAEGATDASTGASADVDAGGDGAREDGGGRDAEAGPAPGDASPCAPPMTGMRGLTSQTVTVSGTARTYLMYLPQSLDPAARAPLVFAFHGATMSGQQMHDVTQYAALADSEGIAVLFPDGEGGPGTLAPWNVEESGQTVCGAGQLVDAQGDDFAFVDAMRATVAKYQCIESRHVFATGFSMGGYFSHHIGCTRSDVKAIGPHSGGTIASLSSCTTGHVPAIIFHGTADAVIAPGCDDPSSPAQSGFVPSATLWAQKNGCGTTYQKIPVAGSGQCFLYDGCPADGQVELCTFAGMGHCWAGGSTAGQGAASACPTFANATQIEWSFFKHYAW